MALRIVVVEHARLAEDVARAEVGELLAVAGDLGGARPRSRAAHARSRPRRSPPCPRRPPCASANAATCFSSSSDASANSGMRFSWRGVHGVASSFVRIVAGQAYPMRGIECAPPTDSREGRPDMGMMDDIKKAQEMAQQAQQNAGGAGDRHGRDARRRRHGVRADRSEDRHQRPARRRDDQLDQRDRQDRCRRQQAVRDRGLDRARGRRQVRHHRPPEPDRRTRSARATTRPASASRSRSTPTTRARLCSTGSPTKTRGRGLVWTSPCTSSCCSPT